MGWFSAAVSFLAPGAPKGAERCISVETREVDKTVSGLSRNRMAYPLETSEVCLIYQATKSN